MSQINFPVNRRTVSLLGQELDQLWNQVATAWDTQRPTEFLPRVNVAETPQQFEITLELPGMTAEQVSVEYHEGVLTISGERTAETDVSEKTFHRREFQYGKFTRQFRLREVDADHLQAEFQHGILRVTAPKMEVAKPKRVEIKAQ